MKRISLTSMVWWLCMASSILLTSCESTLVDPCEELTNERIMRFREYCYDADGKVKLDRQEGDDETEWMISVETETEVYTTFNQLTGLQIHPAETFDYSYHSEDHRYVCRMVKNVETKNTRYASLYLWIEGCPEIEAIHFVGK